MDLREKKTRASIRRAYLELRAEKGAGRITVRELADRAQVGKATFYLHYRSIYDLSEALQREAIGMIVAGIEEPAALLTAPDRASWQLFSSFEKHRELIDVLFRGEQAAVLSQGIEEAVRERLQEILPDACDNPRLSALSSHLNTYVDWDDHLLTDDLLVLDDGGERTIAARRAQQLPALERRGYSFLGWFSESEGGEKVEQVEGSGDICLYARFMPVVYKITFDLGGGAFKEGFSPVLEYTVLDEVTLPGEEDVLLSGKVFGGWVNEEGKEISSIPLGSVGDIRLTARYSSAAAAAISGFGSRYFWIILDAALALVLLAEAALLTRAAKKRRQAVFAFAPFSSAALFYPLGFYIACAELAAILLMPLLLLRVKRVRARAAAASEMPREQFLAAPFLPPLLMPGEPIAQIDEIDSRLRYRNSYTARLTMSSERAKELYRGFKGYALSYERVRSRISWGGETFFAGKSPLARLNVTGNTLKIYFPLDPSEVGQRYRAQDKRGVKKYALTPVMVKVRSDRALRRARELLDLAAKKLMLQRGAATERVLDNEELLRREASRRELIDKGFIKSDISFKEKDA